MGSWRAGLLLLSLVPLPACAPAPRGEVVLNVGRALNEREAATVVVRVGALRRGQEIVVTTTSGQLIGTISPFGIGAGKPAGSYALPVSAGVITGDKLALRLTLIGDGPERAPSAKEVSAVSLSLAAGPARGGR